MRGSTAQGGGSAESQGWHSAASYFEQLNDFEKPKVYAATQRCESNGSAGGHLGTRTLTQKALEVLWTAMLRPVCILQMPHCPLLPREQMLHLEAGGGIAAGVCAEPRGDLKPPIGDSVVPGAQSGPIPEALLPATFLLEDEKVDHHHTGPSPRAISCKGRGPTQETWTVSGLRRQHMESSTHLLCRHHCYNGNTLFPYHLPEILAGIL